MEMMQMRDLFKKFGEEEATVTGGELGVRDDYQAMSLIAVNVYLQLRMIHKRGRYGGEPNTRMRGC